MSEPNHPGNHTRISDVLSTISSRDIPSVRHNARLSDIVRAMVDTTHSRLLYVVDNEKRLIGSISLGALMRHAFNEFVEPKVHSRSMIDTLVNETAEHLMRPNPVCATTDETVRDVLERLIQANVKEFPVVDKERKIVADLTAVDLIKVLMIDENP